jgi:transcription termination factor Rho
MSTQLNAADVVGQTPEKEKVEEKAIKDIPVEPVRPRRSAYVGRSRGGYSRNSHAEDRDQSAENGHSAGSKADEPSAQVTGFLDTSLDGHGVLRVNFSPSEGDAYISTSQIRRLKLRPGDVISGPARAPKENERYWGLLKVDTVNGESPEKMMDRVRFQTLTPVYPNEQIKLETGEEPLSTRVIDMVAPIGKGQRSLIVSPPKAGKTTLLMQLATGIAANYPDIHLMAVLVGERPEEVTDFRRHIERITKGKGEVAASNFDESAEDQCRVAEIALERAKRLVERGQDVVILLDSITRLARAYNLSIPTSGRTLSGGFDPAALFPPKKFFGAARNFEVGGSLTIIATCLVDTGSRMDDLVYEEFKGTGNQEVHLDRRLAERRIYPAIDVQRSGTRRDDLLIDPMTYQSVLTLQRMLDLVDKEQRTQTIIDRMRRTSSNKEFLASLKEG